MPKYLRLALVGVSLLFCLNAQAYNYDVLGPAFKPEPEPEPESVAEQPELLQIAVPASTDNMYFINGSVNDMGIRFLIDTGATYTTFNKQQAERLKLDYLKGKKGVANTASGTTVVYLVNIDSIKIGPIEKHNVKAYVVDGNRPYYALLGMSFLNDFEIVKKKGVLTIQSPPEA